MGLDLWSEAGMEGPTSAGGGFKRLPVKHLSRPVEVRHGVDFIPVIKVEEEHVTSNGIQFIEPVDKTALS